MVIMEILYTELFLLEFLAYFISYSTFTGFQLNYQVNLLRIALYYHALRVSHAQADV